MMSRVRPSLLGSLLLVLLLLISACGGAAEFSPDESARQTFNYTTDGGDLDGLATRGGASEQPPYLQSQASETGVEYRRVIHTARMHLETANTLSAYEEIASLARKVGGFVQRSEISETRSVDERPEITIVLRVPSSDLTETLVRLRSVADRVVFETLNSEDVSEQFVDLNARLANLKLLELELQELLADVRSHDDADPQKLLQVFNEIASVRGQIEQIEGRLQYLSNLTDLATVEVHISPTPEPLPIVDEEWVPSETIRDAARNLVDSLQALAKGAIHFAVFLLPLVLLIGALPGFAVFVLWRRLRSKRHTAEDPTEGGASAASIPHISKT